MPIPQLIGHTASNPSQSSTRAVLVAVLTLAGILAVIAWRALSHDTPAIPSQPPVVATVATPAPKFIAPEDMQTLRLAHAEQSLVAAAEQLNAARRLLANLSPELSRSYLQFEKRRADSAWTACEAAQRAIEQARDDIKTVSSTRKDE